MKEEGGPGGVDEYSKAIIDGREVEAVSYMLILYGTCSYQREIGIGGQQNTSMALGERSWHKKIFTVQGEIGS